MNWLASARINAKLDLSSVVLVCLDEKTSVFVAEKLRWECFGLHGGKEGKLSVSAVANMFVIRVEHLRGLLKAGLNVVMTDTDAIWKKDAVWGTKLLSGETGDIVASRSFFPYDLPWGATLCMGLAFFKSTPAVIELMDDALMEAMVSKHDQVGVNHALGKLKFLDPKNTKKAFGRKISPVGLFRAEANMFVGDKPLKLVLLAHTSLPRYCDAINDEQWASNVEIAHCHVNGGIPAPTNKHIGNGLSHTAMLLQYGLYLLPTEWEARLDDAFALGGATTLDEALVYLVKSREEELVT